MSYDVMYGGGRMISTGEVTTAGYIYDTGTLAWIPQTNQGGGGPSSNVTVVNSSIAVTQAGSWTVSTTGLTDTQLRASAVPVSIAGTLAISAASLPLPAGAATESTLSSLNTKTPALGQAVMASSVPVVLASNQSAVPVSGTFWQATQPVSGTFWQATQPVSGPLTDTQLRASAVPVSQSGTWTVTTGGLTDTQLRASAVPVSGTFWQATQPVSASSLPLPSGAATSAKQPALGTAGTAANDVLTVQGIASMTALKVDGSAVTQPVSIGSTVNTSDAHTTAGSYLSVRLTDGSAFYTASGGGGGSNPAAGLTGSAVPTYADYTGYNSGGNLVGVSTSNPLPVAQQGSVAVTGTFWQTTQPVSIASTLAVAGPTASGSSLTAAPLTVGGRASTTNPTAVSDGQVVNERFDKTGRAIVRVGQARELYGRQATTITSSTTATTIVTAGGSGVFTDITSLTITNSSATALTVILSDGTTPVTFALAANGGIALANTFFHASSANTAWTLQCGTSVASIYVAVVYEKNV